MLFHYKGELFPFCSAQSFRVLCMSERFNKTVLPYSSNCITPQFSEMYSTHFRSCELPQLLSYGKYEGY
jgi:aromatic ring-cleaving dioxygenase